MKRINMTQARKLYNNGASIVIVPCNLRPGGWGTEVSKATDGDFDRLVNAYTYYNCIGAEVGRYPAYYID